MRVVDNVGSGSVFLIELPVKHVHVSPSKFAPLAEEQEEHEEDVYKRQLYLQRINSMLMNGLRFVRKPELDMWCRLRSIMMVLQCIIVI